MILVVLVVVVIVVVVPVIVIVVAILILILILILIIILKPSSWPDTKSSSRIQVIALKEWKIPEKNQTKNISKT